MKHITTTDTAKMIRASLKEAFAGVRFSVRSRRYAGGCSIDVSWLDGPNQRQVDGVIDRFQGSYFDGSIDYQGYVTASIDGEAARFSADFISTTRDYSDAAIQRALAILFRKFGTDRLQRHGQPISADALTHKAFQNGDLWAVEYAGWSRNLQQLVYEILGKHSDRLAPKHSRTAGAVMVLGDDGYGAGPVSSHMRNEVAA